MLVRSQLDRTTTPQLPVPIFMAADLLLGSHQMETVPKIMPVRASERVAVANDITLLLRPTAQQHRWWLVYIVVRRVCFCAKILRASHCFRRCLVRVAVKPVIAGGCSLALGGRGLAP
jgi:hypothetical protein